LKVYYVCFFVLLFSLVRPYWAIRKTNEKEKEKMAKIMNDKNEGKQIKEK